MQELRKKNDPLYHQTLHPSLNVDTFPSSLSICIVLFIYIYMYTHIYILIYVHTHIYIQSFCHLYNLYKGRYCKHIQIITAWQQCLCPKLYFTSSIKFRPKLLNIVTLTKHIYFCSFSQTIQLCTFLMNYMLIPIDHTIYRNVYALQLYAPLNIFQ